MSQKLAEGEETAARMRSARASALSELEAMRQNSAEIRSEKEQAERSSEFADVRKKDLRERLGQIKSELESLAGQLAALEGKAEGDAKVKQMQLELVMADDEIFKRQSSGARANRRLHTRG